MKIIWSFLILSLLVGCKTTTKTNKFRQDIRQFQMESIRPELEKNGNLKYIELFGTNGCQELLSVIDKLNIVPDLIERKRVVVRSDVNNEEFDFQYRGRGLMCPKDRYTSDE